MAGKNMRVYGDIRKPAWPHHLRNGYGVTSWTTCHDSWLDLFCSFYILNNIFCLNETVKQLVSEDIFLLVKGDHLLEGRIPKVKGRKLKSNLIFNPVRIQVCGIRILKLYCMVTAIIWPTWFPYVTVLPSYIWFIDIHWSWSFYSVPFC